MTLFKEPSCHTCQNQLCPIQKYCKPDWKSKITKNKLQISCKAEHTAIYEGAPVSGIYFVYVGKLKIHKSVPNKPDLILKLAGPGDVLGHRGYGDTMVYPISAVALEDASLCYFDYKTFFETVRQNPEFSIQMMLIYAFELKKAERRIYELASSETRERLLHLISEMIQQFGINSKGCLAVPFTRSELASYVGTTYETTMRILSQLKKNRILEFVGNNTIKIFDKKFFVPAKSRNKETVSF